jgi:hypothetical protein
MIMFELVVHSVGTFLSSLPFSSATWFVIATLVFFIYLFAKANKNPNSPIRWEHLLIDSSNDRVSPYKLGYIIGLIVGTQIVLTFLDSGKLSFDIFGTYLTYLLGGASVNSITKKDKVEAPKLPALDEDDIPKKG